jgi:FixJ family two-component response regulator
VRLTPRETQVLDYLIRGYNSRQIGMSLGISHRTAENHRQHIFKAHKVNSIVELLTRIAREQNHACPFCGRAEAHPQ